MIPEEDKTKKQPDFVINRAPDIPIEDIPEESDVTEEAFDFTQATRIRQTLLRKVLCVKVRWGQLRLPMKLRVLQQKLRRQQRL